MPKERRHNNTEKNLPENIPNAKCVAIIGDIIGSRTLGLQRPVVQKNLFEFLDRLNHKYRETIISNFIVTTGDEFQGLISQSESLPDVIWEIEIYFLTQVRLGIGCGTLNTRLQREAIGMDGPAWYLARDAIKEAYRDKRYGGVFKGFSETDDVTLNGFARILHFYRERLTKRQIKIISMFKSGLSQIDIAQKLKVSKQAISNHLISSGWSSYEEAEKGWKTVLKVYNFKERW